MGRPSVVIITRNEALRIRQVVHAARQVSDDIIVVDAESEDRTVDEARAAGARVIVRPWTGYGSAKNFGNEQARNDWILSIDGDEVISKHLATSILEKEFKNRSVYAIKVHTYFCGRRMRFSEIRPAWKIRLFNRQNVLWNDREVHENLVVPEGMKTEKLPGPLEHYSYESVDDMQQKGEAYAKLMAERMYKNNIRHSYLKMKLAPLYRFFKSYILQAGILEGKAGFQVSVMSARIAQMRYEFLDKMEN